MRYQTLIHNAKTYWPVILLEQHFAHSKRKLLRMLSSFIFWITGAGMFITSITLPAQAPNEIAVILSELAAYQNIMLPVLALSLLVWLILFALDGYYYSHWFSGLATTLPEHRHKKQPVSYEVAEILYANPIHPTQALLESSLGREILVRAGMSFEQLATVQTTLRPETIDWPDTSPYNLAFFLQILSQHDEGFMQSLFRSGVRTEHLLGAARWVESRTLLHKQHRRKWGREKLGRIPGIAKDWSYGYVYYLEKFAQPIEATNDYASTTLESHHHQKEAREVEAILARGREANVLLVGKEGVGKLGIMARVAKEISQGNIFPQLEHKHIYVVDGQALVSSGDGKNAFEQTLRLVLNESAQAGNIILVITDLHTVIQSAQAVGSDLIALLDPYLTTNTIQIVGITNEQSYFGLLERIPKIIQRFDKVDVQSGDRNETLSVVLDYVDDLEGRHHLAYTYPAVARLVDNADRYIASGVMPDKALDILLELTTLLSSQGVKIVTEPVVNQFFTEKTNIPVGEVGTQERETLLRLEQTLHQRVIGQDEAVKAVATTMRRARAGVQNPDRPIGSFLFLGPTGVGKTEVSKSLAAAFFGNEEAMMRFDMSEYKTYDSLDKLIGSFQTGQSGTLSKALKQKPYGLLLLDEFEKSNDQVKDLFLQILDEGKFADMNGNTINARSTIIIATSNAGADIIWNLFEQGKNPAHYKQDLINAIINEGIYKPELLNRFDGVVVFHPLASADLLRIAGLMLKKLEKRILKNKGIAITYTDEVVRQVATKGSNPQFGARPMNRYIQETIEQVIADKILAEGVRAGMTVHLTEADLTL